MRRELAAALMVVLLFSAPAPACQGGCDGAADCPHHEAGAETMVTPGEATAVDPICGMVISEPHAADRLEYQGTTYFFCRKGEKERFLRDPQAYLGERSGEEPSVGPPDAAGHGQ